MRMEIVVSRWRDRWSNAPWWVVSIVMGLYFGGVMTVVFAVNGHGFHLYTLVIGIVLGVFFGWVMGPLLVSQRDNTYAAMGLLENPDRPQVIRAANRGAVPVDRQVRAAAARVVRYRLGEMSSQRRWAVPFWVAITLISAGTAVLQTAWWFVATAILVFFLILTLVQPRRMRHRLEALEADG